MYDAAGSLHRVYDGHEVFIDPEEGCSESMQSNRIMIPMFQQRKQQMEVVAMMVTDLVNPCECECECWKAKAKAKTAKV